MKLKLLESIETARAQYSNAVLALLIKRPSLSYKTVADRTGGSPRTVARIAAAAGIRRTRGPKSKK